MSSRGTKRIDWSAYPLGKVADREIAAMAGVHRQSVIYARNKRGIPPFSPAPGQGARLVTLAKLVTDKVARDTELAHLRKERDALQDKLAPIHVMIETLERLGTE